MSVTRKRYAEMEAAKQQQQQNHLAKRRKRSINVKDNFDHLNLCGEILDHLRYYRADDNRLLCEQFIRAPSRRIDAEYFKVVERPIDFTRIQQKIKTEEYTKLDEFQSDIQLLIDNNKKYFEKGSQEYTDACKLSEVYEDFLLNYCDSSSDKDSSQSMINGSTQTKGLCSGSKSGSAVDVNILEDTIVRILVLTDEAGRLLSPPFRVLLPHEEFPTYYERIKIPIDLKAICTKIRNEQYQSWNNFESDFRLMCRNAKVFNETGSTIYKDANILLRYFKNLGAEVNDGTYKNPSSKKIMQNKKAIDELMSQSASNVVCEVYSEDSEEDEDTEHNDDEKWIVYWAVRNESNPSDPESYLSDYFTELPSKSYYPDYYSVIKHPMSLFIVNKKLKRGSYTSLNDLLADLNLIFENAKSYNLEKSEIYQAAVRLSKISSNKVRSLTKLKKKRRFDASNVKMKKEHEGNMDEASVLNDDLLKDGVDRGNDSQIMQVDGSKYSPAKTPRRKYTKERNIPSVSSSATNSVVKMSSTSNIDRGSRTGKPGRKSLNELLSRYRTNLWNVWSAVYSYREGDRRLADNFLNSPSRIDAPSNSDIVSDPIDLIIVKEKIEADQYATSDEFMADLYMLFDHTQKVCEKDSCINNDAATLRSVAHASLNDIPMLPLINPIHLKEKYGWRWTKLPVHRRACVSRKRDCCFGGEEKENSLSSLRSDMTPMNRTAASRSVASIRTSSISTTYSSIKRTMVDLYTAVKNFRDCYGRRLSTAFLQLPSKADYPGYYDVIRKPVDLAKIGHKISTNFYESIDALISDFITMFDNACRYNEPDCSIYRDALCLQKVVLQKKKEVCKSGFSVPDPQELLRSLHIYLLNAIYNHQDADGRLYSETLAEVSLLLKRKAVPPENMPFKLHEIEDNITKGRYRRLDRFQEDLFDLFDAARIYSRTDSQIFHDTIELQLHYIKLRDELTKYFISPARSFTERVLMNIIEQLRSQKLLEESETDKASGSAKKDTTFLLDGQTAVDSVENHGIIYQPHDYVYVSSVDSGAVQRRVMRIEDLYTNSENVTFVRGVWCFRPEETYHISLRKFLKNELFLTNFRGSVSADRLCGKCHVMFIRSFLKMKPKGFDDNNIYVCESQYRGKYLHFKKLKHWPYKDDKENLEYERRDEPLTGLSRFPSLFRTGNSKIRNNEEAVSDGGDEHDFGEFSSLNEHSKNLPPVLEKRRIEVPVKDQTGRNQNGHHYFQQLEHCGRWYRLGDYVYVYNPLKNLMAILRIDKLWRSNDEEAMFSGPYFARPSEIEHEPSRVFFKREVFAVEQPDIQIPLNNIEAPCVVLSIKDYVRLRPTEIDEMDVYVVQYKVAGKEPPLNHCNIVKAENPADAGHYPLISSLDEDAHSDAAVNNSCTATAANNYEPFSESSARKLKSLKVYHCSSDVLEPEIILFKTPILMEKEMSPLLMQADSSNVAIHKPQSESTARDCLESTPGKELVAWLATQPKLSTRSKSGYILFSAEIRKRVMQANPEAGFGEVSKIVGVEWKKLTEDQKKQYEFRAEQIANERARQEAQRPQQIRLQPGQICVYMCRWQACYFQYDTVDALYEHVKTAHTSQIVEGENQYVCMWAPCLKYRKEGKPFPSLPRLHRHIKDKHLSTAAKSIYPSQKTSYKSSTISQQVQPLQQQSVSAINPNVGVTYVPLPNSMGQQIQPYSIAQAPITGYVTHAVVASNNQIVANGFINVTGTAVAVAPTAYVTTASPAIVHGTTSSACSPYQPIRQVTTATIAQNYAGMPVQSVSYAGPSTSQQSQPVVADPGRTVVHAPKQLEPVLVAPTNVIQVKRVMHSEAYIKYIESLSSDRPRTVSKWDRSLRANAKNASTPNRSLPLRWLKDPSDGGASEEDVAKALWKLRDSLLEDTLNITREIDFVESL